MNSATLEAWVQRRLREEGWLVGLSGSIDSPLLQLWAAFSFFKVSFLPTVLDMSQIHLFSETREEWLLSALLVVMVGKAPERCLGYVLAAEQACMWPVSGLVGSGRGQVRAPRPVSSTPGAACSFSWLCTPALHSLDVCDVAGLISGQRA